ncbi:MAG: hypothetical protein K1X28_01745 [Parachlamydiales bacterium]|nr:hypothetical protein [Parachlamydiales bacterium]
MTIAPICSIPYRPLFEIPLAPIKAIVGLFLKTLGYLLLFFGATEFGKSLQCKGIQYLAGCDALFTGLWSYGFRFLVPSNNYEECCRGSSYWFIDAYLANPERNLEEIALEFQDGAPMAAVEMHRQNTIPASISERRIWSHESARRFPPMPDLDPGVYSILVGFSRDENHPGKAHRFVFIRGIEKSFLFDPNTGLSIWDPADWKPLLERIGSNIRTSSAGYFTIECYNYTRNI